MSCVINALRSLSSPTPDLPIGAIARLVLLTVGLLLTPGLLMSFSLAPANQMNPAADIKPQSTSVIKSIADVAQGLPAPILLPQANEFTRHLNVVALHDAINVELQIITNTTDAFAGRIDQSQLVVAEVIEESSRDFRGVGYPHIETASRSKTKRFRSLITYADLDTRSEPIPNVRCMGLSPRAVANRAKRYSNSVEKLAVKYSIDANLVRAVMTRESCFNNAARSYVGAIGLMQLMPETAAWLKVEDPTNASQNLKAGVRYLASLKKRFGTNELALAAYNAGPGNVERHNGIPPFKETRHYVESVMSHYRSYVATEQFTSAVALN